MRPQVPQGMKVWYEHERFPDETYLDAKPSPKGGTTKAFLYPADGTPHDAVAYGTAYCHGKDNFNKRIGRDIALGRALKSLRAATKKGLLEKTTNA